jgi:hypothetical protein
MGVKYAKRDESGRDSVAAQDGQEVQGEKAG